MKNATHLPILLVCGCQKYLQYVCAGIKRFHRPEEWHTIGLLGDSTLTIPVFDESSSILTLPVPDTYESLPRKIHAALEWIHEQWPTIPGVFKTDDDIVIHDLDHLSMAIKESIVTKTAYCGINGGICSAGRVNRERIETHFTNKQKQWSHKGAHYCYGAGYWLSTPAIRIAIAAKKEYASACLEDVCTGYVMNSAGIRPLKLKIAYTEHIRDDALLLPKLRA